MRKIKLFIASSLDGYIATEDGSIDWLYTDSDYGYTQFYNSVDTILLGRKTYDKLIELAAEYPHKDKKNYVFSQKKSARQRKEKEKDHNVEFIADIIDFVKMQLLQSQGKDIWLIGGADIISIFLNAGMLDEIILSIHPIILGRGIPLFRNLQRQMNLKLVKSIPYESGLIQLHYEL
jgi:dihydrofolate reductase